MKSFKMPIEDYRYKSLLSRMKQNHCSKCKKTFKKGEKVFYTLGRKQRRANYYCNKCVKKMEY